MPQNENRALLLIIVSQHVNWALSFIMTKNRIHSAASENLVDVKFQRIYNRGFEVETTSRMD